MLRGATLLLGCALAIAAKDATLLRVPAWTEEKSAPSEWEASLDGRPVKIVRVLGPSDDLFLIVVFDLVGDLALVDPARQSLMEALKTLPVSSHVALMRAQDGLRVLSDPTSDRAALSEAVRTMPVSGRPNLLDTVEQASRLAHAVAVKASVRVAVLYLTDSAVQEYREDYTNPVINSMDSRDLSRRFPDTLVREKIAKIEGSISGLQAPLFITQLRYERDRLNEAYQNGLYQLAQSTGGATILCRTIAEIPDAVNRTVGRIASSWRIDVEVPDDSRRTVQLELAGAAGLTYRTRFLVQEIRK